MQKKLMEEAQMYVKQSRRQRIWHKFVQVMACVVVFCTTYALILPAITMEKDLCDLTEHTHSESCYEKVASGAAISLVCSYESLGVHVHAPECYDSENQLICGQADYLIHAHNEDCLDESGNVVCRLPEADGHMHTDACYRVAETESVHTHGDDCYEIERGSLICQTVESEGHSHGQSCYTQGELVCQLTEQEGHTHGEGCSETVLVCELTVESHVHTEGCYTQLVCDLPEDETHTHSEECSGLVLNCTLTEQPHTHSDGCYQTDFLCGIPEAEGHTHETACYESLLTCELAEEAGHAHSDACYETVTVLICGLEEGETAAEPEQELICTEPAAQVHIHSEDCFVAENTEEDLLTCTLAEGHVHGEDCYDESGMLICTEEEDHAHGTLCYGIWELICTQEEHIHDLVCQNDPQADVETEAEWEDAFADVVLTGQWNEDLLAIAESQLGYAESTRNYEVMEDGETVRGYTRYGAWYGDPYGDWCAMFVSFCLNYAEIPRESIPYSANCADWIEALKDPGYDLYRSAAEYTPVTGDLIFFDWEEDGAADHVGIVAKIVPATETEPVKVKTIEGNTDDRVAEREYDLEDNTILGYAQLPQKPTEYYCGLIEHTHTEECRDAKGNLVCDLAEHTHADACAYLRTAEYTYSDEWVSMRINVQNAAGIPDDLEVVISKLLDDSDTYWNCADYAVENLTGNLINLIVYQVDFYEAGVPTEFPDAAVSIDMTVAKEAMLSGIPATMSLDNGEEEGGTVLVLNVLQESDGQILDTASATFYTNTSEDVTAELGNARTFALAASEEGMSEFTMQYYATIPRLTYVDGAPYIEFMDTSGGKLPTNGTAYGTGNELKKFSLTQYSTTAPYQNTVTATTYKLYMPDTGYTQICADETRTYYSGITVEDLDVLRDNANYTLNNIWTRYWRNDAWTEWKEYGPEATFTNNPEEADDAANVLLIEQDMQLYFEYAPTTSTQSNSANFFDYDISSGYIYNGMAEYPYSESNPNGYATYNSMAHFFQHHEQNSLTWKAYMYTYKRGINSYSNYRDGNGSIYFAYGNENAGSGWSEQVWNGQTLNKANIANYKVCTFGLVRGYDYANDRLVYSNGITAPYLFNYSDGQTVTGKTSYAGQTLDFQRVGDTYTLVSVNGGLGGSIGAERLDEFFVASYDTSYTNNFWPVDNTIVDSTVGHDFKFGSATAYNNYMTQFWTASEDTEAYSGQYTGRLPLSDNGHDHNSYFGMQYAVQFTLDGKYVGPLEYVFYGDDDMYVFLTDNSTQESWLICDIGGVHSSVGSYTNLWDWIEQGEAGAGTYTLTFFYSERGASGSSCFMQFTLPSVVSVSQNTPETGSVRLSKDLSDSTGADLDRQYSFTFTLAGSGDYFPYTIYNALGTEASSGKITSGQQFTLKADQEIVISGIPQGLTYTITEADETDYVTGWMDGQQGRSYTSTVSGGTTQFITCTNTVLNSLILEKQATGAYLSGDEEYTFEVELTDALGTPLTGTYGSYIFNDSGIAEITLKSGQQAEITDLPLGTLWSVTELTTEGFEVSYTVNGIADQGTAGGTISADGNTVICHNAQLVGSLSLTKQLVGITDDTLEFSFTAQLTPPNGTTLDHMVLPDGATIDENGLIRLTLAHGETATIRGIPLGTRWTVQETGYDGYIVSWAGTPGSGVGDSAGGQLTSGGAAVTFTNKVGYELPQTGGAGTYQYTMGGLLIMLMAAAISLYIHSIKRRKEERPSF